MDVEAALRQAERVFGRRERPVNVDFCPCCFSAKEVRRYLSGSPLEHGELSRLVWKAYTTWGNWPALAYLMPQILQSYLTGGMDEEMLYMKLLLAVRPEVDPEIIVGGEMTPEERAAVYAFFQAVLDQRIAQGVEQAVWPFESLEVFAFLAAMPEPVGSLIARYRNGSWERQGYWVGVLAQLVESGYVTNRRLPQTYLEKLRATPENEEALLAELEPEAATLYLLNHREAVRLFGDEMVPVVEAACGLPPRQDRTSWHPPRLPRLQNGTSSVE